MLNFYLFTELTIRDGQTIKDDVVIRCVYGHEELIRRRSMLQLATNTSLEDDMYGITTTKLSSLRSLFLNLVMRFRKN